MSFGNSFVKGLDQGENSFYKAQDAARQKVLDERATTLYGQQQAAYQRQLGIQQETDSARQSLKALDGGVFDGSKANFGINEGVAPDGPMPAEAYKAPSVGLTPRKATDLEFNQAFQREALARGDMPGLQTLRTAGKGFEYDDAFTTGNAEWDKKTDAEKASLIKQYSYDQNVRGHGNWVAGKGKTEGYMNFMPESGDPVQMSNKEARALFSLVGAMNIDPARARKEMEGVSDKVRLVAKELFETQTKAAKEVNDTRKDQGMLAIQQQQADQTGAYYKGTLARGGGGREADPKLVARNNELYTQLTAEEDPAKRKLIERQLQVVQTQIATSLGKPMMLPAARDERLPISNADVLSFVEKMGSAQTRVPDPAKPGKFLTVSQLPMDLARVAAQQFFSPQPSGSGLPDVAAPKIGGLATKIAPVAAPRRYDSDGNPIPADPSAVNMGYSTPDARGLLRTPSYRSSITQFNPD